MTNMTNEQQERQIPENKIKEYIAKASEILEIIKLIGGVYITKNSPFNYVPSIKKNSNNILLVAQMLQREEHFNNNETFKEQTSRINTLADNLSEATQILKLNNTKE